MRYNRFLENALGDALSSFEPGTDKADIFLNRFLKNRRIGKRDREWIRDRFFFYFRHKLIFEKLHGFSLPHLIAMLYDNESEQELQIQLDNLKKTGKFNTFFYESFPEFLKRNIEESFNNTEIYKWLNTKAKTILRANLLKIDRARLKKLLLNTGIDSTETPLSPAGLILLDNSFNLKNSDLFNDGLFEFQDESSQLASMLVNKDHKTFFEPCAGSGGKSLAVKTFSPEINITASDIRPGLFNEIKKRSKKMGTKIKTLRLDQTDGMIFDTVFIDAPCSGSGVLRRNPADRWTISEEFIKDLNGTQLSILSEHAGKVRNGGELIYVTCSLLKQENENIISEFLNKFNNFERVGAIERLKENLPVQNISSITDGFYFKTAPFHERDILFGAVLRRIS